MTEYTYGSEFHINLAVRVMDKLLDNHDIYNSTLKYSTEDRASYIAAESFAIAEAMITQINAL